MFFSPQGHGSRGPGVSITAKISARHGTSRPCPEGEENERHMGPSVPGPSWLGSRGRAWAPEPGNRGRRPTPAASEKRHLSGAWVSNSIVGGSPPTQPRLSPASTAETQTPARKCVSAGGGGRGCEGGNTVSKQLLESGQIPVPPRLVRNLRLSCRFAFPSSK